MPPNSVRFFQTKQPFLTLKTRQKGSWDFMALSTHCFITWCFQLRWTLQSKIF